MGYNVGMANPPAKNLPELPARHEEAFRLAAAELIGKGRSPGEIAKAVEPDDPKKQKSVRQKLRRWVREDPIFQMDVAKVARGELIQGLGPASAALRRRAARGNPTAIRLLFEATGFHNTKVKHEHSGDVTVKLEGIPRPAKVEEDDHDIVEAEVVED